jgi:hypothetical protein
VMQEFYKSVPRELEGVRVDPTTVVFQECYKSLTKVLEGCYKGCTLIRPLLVTRVLQKCYKSDTVALW